MGVDQADPAHPIRPGISDHIQSIPRYPVYSRRTELLDDHSGPMDLADPEHPIHPGISVPPLDIRPIPVELNN